MSLAPRALVLNAPGINCNFETGFAIEQAGGRLPDVIFIRRIFTWR
jgi:phosphoribosylformylglycinamidine (FGAM) synthase-like amidotransferase family enzyme